MRKSTKALSKTQEKKIAKKVDGDLIPASGGLQTGASWKGDINTKLEKFECKITENPFYVLKFNDLIILKMNAAKDSTKEAVFIFEFKDKERYVVTFCGEEEYKKAFISFQTDDKSYKLRASDLRNMSAKTKGSVIGIKFLDKERNTWRCIIINDFINWMETR